ncbi:MAG: exodeoxyribonuclease III, partial [Alphaproteobacteria bacterium]|nr:exodeoxyribonuclease III [Alphaproteobacteria bacterium]
LHNFYIPAGGDIADEESNPKFAHKLGFIREATAWFGEQHRKTEPMVLLGDLNIAPLENDVWSHKYMSKIVSHTPIEIEHLNQLQASLDWHDAIRHFVPPCEKLYSWWSYRAKDWLESNRGLRLDHIWLTPPLVGNLRSGQVLSHTRGWESPSDHAPVMIELEI